MISVSFESHVTVPTTSGPYRCLMHASTPEQQSIEQVRSRVRSSNPARPPVEIDRTVDEAYRHFRDVRVRDFVPLLVERRVVESLRAPA